MAILLDTATLPAGDRHEAFRSAMAAASGATSVELGSGPGGVSGRMVLVELGRTRIFTAQSSSIAMRRDRRTAAGASPEAVAIAVHGLGLGRHQLGDRQRLVRAGDVMVVDVTRPFDFSWDGLGSSASLQVPIVDLDLPLDAVQRAAPRLGSSPLYWIVGRYLTDLAREADRLSAASSAPALDQVSIQLIRALISGALEDGAGAHDILEQSLLAQVRVYVGQHVRDPDLNADRIAAALAVSRRQLFRICADAGFSLEQYVISTRLAGARADLARPAARSRSIAGVAHSWGFKDPTHFARRFKAAYGVLPRDWRGAAAAAGGGSAGPESVR